jgi:hypothetical protein
LSNELIQLDPLTPLEASWERCGGYLSDYRQSVAVVPDVCHSEQWVVVVLFGSCIPEGIGCFVK